MDSFFGFGLLDEIPYPETWNEVSDCFDEGRLAITKNEKWGLINRRGELILPIIFDSFFYFQDGFATLSLNGKNGLINLNGETVIPFEYESISFPKNCKIVAAKNGKFGIMNLQYEVIFPFKYEYISDFNDDYVCVLKEGKYGLVNYSDEILIDFEWELMEIVGENFCVGKTVDIFFNRKILDGRGIFYDEYFKHFTNDYQKIVFGIIDIHKNVLFPFISDSKIHLFNPEKGIAKISKNTWENPDLEEPVFIADRSGNKIPFTTSTKDVDFTEFHRICEKIVFGH